MFPIERQRLRKGGPASSGIRAVNVLKARLTAVNQLDRAAMDIENTQPLALETGTLRHP
jgi:hypothetical protein